MIEARRPMIELLNLHRFFGNTRAVDNISFEVYPGQVMGYIGPNGAGKTTSMRILATLDQPTYGDAYVDGFSCVDDPDRVRSRLGFMPDYYGTYSNVNVREYLDFFGRAYGLRGVTRLKAIEHAMRFTKLDELADKPVNALSKGMKQRLCLGRSMIHDPAVMILDEPAAGLDPRARIQFREMVRELSAAGKTLLISSHILSELAEMCDVVAIIEQGKLLAVGSVDDIEKAQPGRNSVQVRVLSGAEGLAAWLTARGGVFEMDVSGDRLTFVHDGDLAAESALLKEIVLAGFPVVAFGTRKKTLEQVFMQVTEGRVQ
ncbi:MAG: ABC transporter ATP-binding protein [Planctomycetia bacterium]|nr:ABC transporter ATP-binding protein [Planctomycetia bacterium]